MITRTNRIPYNSSLVQPCLRRSEKRLFAPAGKTASSTLHRKEHLSLDSEQRKALIYIHSFNTCLVNIEHTEAEDLAVNKTRQKSVTPENLKSTWMEMIENKVKCLVRKTVLSAKKETKQVSTVRQGW